MLVVYLGLQNCRRLRLVLIPFSLIPTASLKQISHVREVSLRKVCLVGVVCVDDRLPDLW